MHRFGIGGQQLVGECIDRGEQRFVEDIGRIKPVLLGRVAGCPQTGDSDRYHALFGGFTLGKHIVGVAWL